MPLLSLAPKRSRSVWISALLAAILFSTANVLAQGAGYWHTSGNLILDANNTPVRIAGINWYGFETPSQTPGGLYVQDYKSILHTIKAEGYNTVRLPISGQMVESPATQLNIQYSNASGPINTDLKGLNALQVLDKIVDYAGTLGLKIILDHHRSDSGASAESNGLWFTSTYPESNWIADWIALSQRYLGNPALIGFDLHNEPHLVPGGGACWDCGGLNDWHLAAERAGNAVLAVNPHLLIIVEGVDTYRGDSYWWGGNLEGVQNSPVVLSTANQIVYSAHDYGPNEAKQSWFNGTTTYSALAALWTKHWGYISQNKIAPVWLGEFGTSNQVTDLKDSTPGSQGQWFQSMVTYLGTESTINWNYWAVNGEDIYGLLDPNDDPAPASAQKQAMLATILFPLSTGTTTPPAPTKLTATTSSATSVGLKWVLVAGSGVTFAIFFGTSSGNEKTLLANGVASNSYQATNLNPNTPYFFTVRSMSNGIASQPSNEASATTSPAAAPNPPTALTATSVSSSQIRLAWTASSTPEVTYTVYGGTNAANLTTPTATAIGSTNYVMTGLNPGTAYFFVVRASSQGSISAASNSASATTASVPLPTTPAGLQAVPVGTSEIDLTWQPVTTSGATYTLIGGTSPSALSSVVASNLTAASFKVTGLKPSTQYFYAVKAIVQGLASTPSSIASATTSQTPTPATPTGLTAAASSVTQINLSWTASTVSGTTYTVTMGLTADAVNNVIATGVAVNAYQAINLHASTAYFFTVTAVVQGVSSAPSTVASGATKSVTPPAPPTGVAASATSSTQVTLSWVASPTPGVTYSVYASKVAGTIGSLVANGVAANTYSATGLLPATTYFFSVKAVSGALGSAASNVASVTTPATAQSSCHVQYTPVKDWGTGFTASIAISNEGATPINNWTLGWTFAGNQQVTQSWDGQAAENGEAVTFTNAGWNGTIAPNSTSSGIGFQASYTGINAPPTAFFVNGVPCK